MAYSDAGRLANSVGLKSGSPTSWLMRPATFIVPLLFLCVLGEFPVAIGIWYLAL